MATFYTTHVRRKTGEWQTEAAVKQGSPPKRDDVIEANFHGEKIRARVLQITTDVSKAQGRLTVQIHAEEIKE